MNANRYMRDSLRTADRSNMDRLKLECALGLCGEAGEVAEQVKKHFFHGHELDKRHMIEELGDVAWYWPFCVMPLVLTLIRSWKKT